VDRRELYTLTGSIIRITDPESHRVHLFSVESAANDKAMIRPCNSEAKAFATSRPEGQQLAVTAGTSDGVLHGTVTVERYLVSSRMLMIDNPPLEFEQRRESFRVVVALPITLGLPRGDELVMVNALTLDVSQGGFAVTFPDADLPATGELLPAVLQAPAETVVAVVEMLGMHPDRKATMRARFHQIAPLDQTLLAADLRRVEVTKVRTQRVR
jgi:hypothetical protein